MIRARVIIATLAAATSLAGCTMLDGYGGVSVGYGGDYYDDGYYDSYYGGSYYGWYEDFYYPGLGAYVYDRGGRRHGWNDRHRRYWEARRAAIRDRRDLRENWSRYRRGDRDGRGDGWRGGGDRDGRDWDGRREGWRDRGDGGRTPGSDARRERRGGWQERGANASPSAPPARQWRHDGAQRRDEARRERRPGAPQPAARAVPQVDSDSVRAPRPQTEPRSLPQASRPEPGPRRLERPESGEDRVRPQFD